MVAAELLQYIAQSKASGFNQEQIMAALRSAGWAEDMIAEAFSGTTAITSTVQPASAVPAPASNQQTNVAQNTEEELARIQNELAQAKTRFHAHADPEERVAGGILGLLTRHHIVKNEAQANVLMIAVSVISIGVSVWIMWPKSTTPTKTSPLVSPVASPAGQK